MKCCSLGTVGDGDGFETSLGGFCWCLVCPRAVRESLKPCRWWCGGLTHQASLCFWGARFHVKCFFWPSVTEEFCLALCCGGFGGGVDPHQAIDSVQPPRPTPWVGGRRAGHGANNRLWAGEQGRRQKEREVRAALERSLRLLTTENEALRQRLAQLQGPVASEEPGTPSGRRTADSAVHVTPWLAALPSSAAACRKHHSKNEKRLTIHCIFVLFLPSDKTREKRGRQQHCGLKWCDPEPI